MSQDKKEDAENLQDVEGKPTTIFTPVKPVHAQHFLIVDTVYENPPYSHLGLPGPDGDGIDLGFKGLSSISEDIYNELPPECRKAFEGALAKELEWKKKWRTETEDSMRRPPIIDKGLIM
jgi:chromatin structure-remodeling complex protein RSC7